ncbi:H/ACA ribonucleoprotein complex non-core subunit NAF1 isoform X2 [Euwallacea fornicatus]|uniref:H/ACA ribonucleoprotein complex non-core subunit NAF1 isoform X2 n=1 Tax=Euwallacea fornicatus TaxID=995702 RepID=UPI00339008AA
MDQCKKDSLPIFKNEVESSQETSTRVACKQTPNEKNPKRDIVIPVAVNAHIDSTTLEKPCNVTNNEANSTTLTSESSDSEVSRIQQEVTKLNISEGDKNMKKPNSIPASKVVVNRESDSLKSLLLYEGSSESEDSDVENKNEFVPSAKMATAKVKTVTSSKKSGREPLDYSSDSGSGSSDSESDSTACTLSSESDSDSSVGLFEHSDDDSGSVIITVDNAIRNESPNKGAVKKTQNKTGRDELELLPPIPDLSQLTIGSDVEFMHMGRVSAIILECVTVMALPNTPAFDLDTMLFINDEVGKKKKPLGPVDDVLGPVSEPIYCVRFNNENEVKAAGIESGMKVFAAPKNEEFTKFVFVKELLKLKGTDASWLNDQEQPTEMAEFSDDEEERANRYSQKTTSGKRKFEDSVERHRQYERTMNQCNTLNTRVCRLMDTHRRLSRHIHHHPGNTVVAPTLEVPPVGCPELSSVLPGFNPTVPPPGYGPLGVGLSQPYVGPSNMFMPDNIINMPVPVSLSGFNFSSAPPVFNSVEGPPAP